MKPAIRVLAMSFVCLICINTITFAQNDRGIDKKLLQVLSDLDRLESKIKSDFDRLETKINQNETKLRGSEKTYTEILELQKKAESGLEEIEKHLSSFDEVAEDSQKANDSIIELVADVKNLKDQLAETKTDVKSSGNVIRWVTAIVSVIVIIIGLFFSKVFLDLYANYKVISSKLEEESGSRTGTGRGKNVTTS